MRLRIVGVNTFKNENYLDEVLHSENPRRHRMLVANECTTGGFICGEIKLATTLWILCGGSPLDMALLFDMSFTNSYKIFNHVVINWLLSDLFHLIDGVKYCSDDGLMGKSHFSSQRLLGGSLTVALECSFGEISLWWEILWSSLRFLLKMNCTINNNVCMKLHNLFCNSDERVIFDDDCWLFLLSIHSWMIWE